MRRRETEKIGVVGGVCGELSVNRGGPGCSGIEKGNCGSRGFGSGDEDRVHDNGKEDEGVQCEETGSWELEVDICFEEGGDENENGACYRRKNIHSYQPM